MRWLRYWMLLALVPLPVAALAVYLPVRDEPLLKVPDSWAFAGSIQTAQPDPRTVYAPEMDSLYFISTSQIGDGSGLLASRTFPAPAWISLSVTGDLTRPGNEVSFRLPGQPSRYRVVARTQPYNWRRVTCSLPADWVGKKIELVLEAGPRSVSNWFGVSNPRALGSGTVLRSHLKALLALPNFAVAMTLFLLPGVWPALRLADRGLVAPVMVVPVAVVIACLAGYLTFWAYFLNRSFGVGFGGVVLLGSLGLCTVEVIRTQKRQSPLLTSEVAIALALPLLVGLFYTALWMSVNLRTSFSDSTRLRFLDFPLMLDDELPYLFADRLYNGGEVRGELLGEWHYSDRPPLQAGLLLLQLPLAYLARQPEEWSLLASSAFQCAWVPAVWSLLRASGLPRRRAGLALLFMVLTGFGLVNTVFAWPKMLPAALVLVAVTTGLFDRDPRGQAFPFGKAVLIGLSAALASLGHGGVAFTLLPFGLFLLLPRYYPGITRLAVAAVVYLVTMFPWTSFQTFYDPPGNLLVRQHLGDRNRDWVDGNSTLWNLAASYEDYDIREILHNKWANVQTLFRASSEPADDQYPWPPDGAPSHWPVDATSFRRCEFMCLFWAPGLMNLGWLVALARAWRQPAAAPAGPGWPVAALGLASALMWVAVMFRPGSTVIHQGSYATVLLLFAALAGWLAILPGRLPYALLVAQAAVFAVAWVLTSPANGFGPPNPVMIVFAILLFFLLTKVALGNWRTPNSAETSAPAGRRSTLDSAVKAKPHR
jgi:hypothetical protein